MTIIDGGVRYVPECRRETWAVSPNSAFIVVAYAADRSATDDRYRFHVIRTSGDTVAAFDRDLLGMALSDSIWGAWLAKRNADDPDVRWNQVPRMQRVVPLQSMLLGDDGSIWVRGIVRGSNRVWQVISRMGQPIAAFELDDDVWLSDPSENGALATRDLPNGQVVLYRLRFAPEQ